MTPAELAEKKERLLKTYGPSRQIREDIDEIWAYIKELETRSPTWDEISKQESTTTDDKRFQRGLPGKERVISMT